MRISISAAPVLLGMLATFASGWFGNEYRNGRRLERIVEERDLAVQMSNDALQMSDKALAHSINNAETLAICLSRLGLRPAEITPTRPSVSKGQRVLAELRSEP